MILSRAQTRAVMVANFAHAARLERQSDRKSGQFAGQGCVERSARRQHQRSAK